jgi:DNA-binding MarR family transcriptional regulator
MTSQTPICAPPDEQQGPSLLSSEGLDALVVLNILRSASQLSPFLDRDLRESDLTSAQLNALLLLNSAASQSLTLTDISRQLLVTKPNVTGLIDRLERKGLVAREGADDRRVTLVRLTEAGHLLLSRIMPERERILAELTQGLSTADKEHLVQLMVNLRRGLHDKRHQRHQNAAAEPQQKAP